MEDFFIGLAVVFGLLALIVPFVALGLTIGARKRIHTLEVENERRSQELRWLYNEFEALKAAPRAGAEAAGTTAEPAKAAEAAAAPRAERAPPPEAATAPAEPARPVPSHDTQPASPAAADGTASTRSTADTAPPAAAKPPPVTPRPPPKRPPPEPSIPSAPAKPAMSAEQRIATYITRIGAVALLFAVLYFYKYAVDNAWIGPLGRVLIGVVVGVVILAIAEFIRDTSRPAYVQILDGVGLAALYISAWASSALYHLVGNATAFAANTVILMLGAALAWRHRAQAVMVVVLAAGFLNPVLLSTGEDRPLGLFAYLFLLTTVALYVSAKQRFQIALPLAIVGVAVLFAGWYQKFFEVFDHRGQPWAGDRPPEELVGAYHDMAKRIVPLGAVALFSAEWLALAFMLRKDDLIPRWSKPVAVAALFLAHAGAAALLHDRVGYVGGAMVVLGAAGVLSLRALEATRFLLIPLLAAFAILCGSSADVDPKDHMILLVLLGLWSSVYAFAFLRDAAQRAKDGPIATGDAVRASIAVFAFAIVASIVVVPHDRYYLLGVLMIGTSVAVAFIASKAGLPSLIMAALVLTGIEMVIGAAMTQPKVHYVDYGFLALVFVWAAVYFAVMLDGARSKRFDGRFSLFLLSFSSLAFLAVSLVSTSSEAPTLRALITGFTGALDLVFAVMIQKTRPDLPKWTEILSAQALALFAPALAFGFSGATITAVWAVLAFVALYILSEARAPVWMIVALALCALVLVRTFAYDIEGLEEQLRQFVYTYGRHGILRVPVFFNARAYAFLSGGASFLAGAFLLARAAKKPRPEDALSSKTLLGTAPVLAVIAYALLIALAVTEVRSALLDLPPAPPMPLDQEEFSLFMQSVSQAKSAQHMLIAMSTTVVLALSAMVLLSIGFLAKDPFHRWLGLLLLLGTVGKLAVWDVWNLPRIYQIVVFAVVAVIALAFGFLYSRLKPFFKTGAAVSAGLICFALSGSAARGEAPQPEPSAPRVKAHLYKSMAPIEGVLGAGDQRLLADVEIYHRSLAMKALDDVRIADEAGHEVPYVVRDVMAQAPMRVINARIFDPGRMPDGGFRATFELQQSAEHCQVELILGGAGVYVHKTKIETGEKLKDYQLVSQGALVYQIDTQGVRASNRTIRYPVSIARYVRVTLLADPQASTPADIEGASFSCIQPQMVQPEIRVPLRLIATTQNKEKKTTEVEIDAGDEGVPIETLHLRIGTREFVRRVEVEASSYKSAWPSVGSAMLYRVGDNEGPESTMVRLREPVRKRWFKLIVEDNDDAPLDISGAEGSLVEREIVFRARAGGRHAFYIGDKDGSSNKPYYDLAAIAARRTEDVKPASVTLGHFIDNPSFGKEQVAAELPLTEKHRTVIAAGLGVILLVLALWALALMRKVVRTGPKPGG